MNDELLEIELPPELTRPTRTTCPRCQIKCTVNSVAQTVHCWICGRYWKW